MSVVAINGNTYEIDCILFDKDGTIIDFTLWVHWAEAFIDLIDDQVSCNKGLLARSLGFSYENRSWDPKGPLAIGSLQDLLSILSLGLYQQGVPWNQAYQVVNDAHQALEESFPIHNHVKPIKGLIHFLEQAKKHGMKMGIVTSDNYEKAVQHLNALGITDYFLTIVGHDLVQRGKPYPEMVDYACEQLHVDPRKTLIIGDSNGDMMLGKNSGVKIRIGIVSVPAMQTGHLQDADYIINDYQAITLQEA
ncbi:HAD-IA family hydrolase [Virgibacillus sp. NKC19-3]|uniref:HAD family hydrolase n=1 Tax=Virgibacillus saliphilus TaxID=2831674 RepID=UPI001C9A81AD|nr:HAD-IA family hydrolase [Virgibacillus sp. NKC19-3]MBY7144652.1 HAD-IA family hydrolase [Virgibacillus sp. NKC19-3]